MENVTDIELVEQDFVLSADREDSAFEDVRQAFLDSYDFDSAMYQKAEQWDRLSEIFEEFGFYLGRADEDNGNIKAGDIIHISFDGNWDKDNISILFSAIAPYVKADSYLCFKNSEEERWKDSFDGSTYFEEEGYVTYQNMQDLVRPNKDVFIVHIVETDEYPGGVIGAAYDLEEARAIAQASCNMTEGAFEYSITKISPGKVEINGEIYKITIKDGEITSTIEKGEPMFEFLDPCVDYPEIR